MPSILLVNKNLLQWRRVFCQESVYSVGCLIPIRTRPGCDSYRNPKAGYVLADFGHQAGNIIAGLQYNSGIIRGGETNSQ